MRVLAVLAVLGACYAPSVQEGAPCGAGNACPSGLQCDLTTLTCVRAPSGAMPDAPPGSCEPGYDKQGGECVDIDECAGANDCSANAACTNEPGSYSCACNAGFTGDGRTCTRVCSSILIYYDCPGEDPDPECDSIADPQLADNAAMGLGMTVKMGASSNETMFRALFDAGGFDVLVFESSLSEIDNATAQRVATWIDNGGKAIVSFWDLDNGTTGQTIRNAAVVTTTGSLNGPRNVVRDPNAAVNLFDRLEQVPEPLVFANLVDDDGDELLPGAGGFIAARHTSATGPGAITVTKNERVITLGFLPVGLIYQGPRDQDQDGKPDVQELYTNMLGYLCGY